MMSSDTPATAPWNPPFQGFTKKVPAPTRAEQIISDAGLRMRKATQQDRNAILEFIRNNFFLDEPLNKAIELVTCDINRPVDEYDHEKFVMASVDENISLVCEPKDNSHQGLAAVLILGIAKRADEANLAEDIKDAPPFKPLTPSSTPDERFERIEHVLTQAIVKADMFNRYPDIDAALDIKILSVDPRYRGKKVAVAMMDKAREFAEERGLQVIRSVCSSHFTALALARLGYECVSRVPYNGFLDSEGNVIFNTEPPHLAVTIYELNLKDKSS